MNTSTFARKEWEQLAPELRAELVTHGYPEPLPSEATLAEILNLQNELFVVRSGTALYTPEWRAEQKARHPLGRKLLDAQRGAADCFAESRGWIRSEKSFSVKEILTGRRSSLGAYLYSPGWPLIDHADYFRIAWRPYKPVAVVTHTYMETARAIAEIEAEGYAAQLLHDSWYAPGNARAIVITRKATP